MRRIESGSPFPVNISLFRGRTIWIVGGYAELSVESKDGMIIVNVHAVNAKNEPVPGSMPAVILLQGKTKTNLDKTLDGKKLAAGNYVVSVVSEGKTASILLTIK
jgi:hypothetical protein